MDVLDHSCSKMGFGGKMCIDGTKKFEEERDESYQLPVASCQLDDELIISKFPEVKAINVSLLENNIPCVIISVEKDRKGHIKELHEQIVALKESEGLKMILYVEHTVDANDLTTALWRFCNNLDPKRDSHICKRPSGNRQPATGNQYFACIGLDGTRKTKELDDFHRDWPNIIVADDETIKVVDKKWEQLNIGSFIASPSLKFKEQMYGEEAVVG